MKNFLLKVASGFSYGAGFILAILCAIYVSTQFQKNQFIQHSQKIVAKKESQYKDKLKVLNVTKLSSFTNYANEGKRESFIFTGEIVNHSNESDFSKLNVEVDLYDSSGKFIFKCGGWDGTGLAVGRNSTETFQKMCYQMPDEIVSQYNNHKVNIKQK